MPFDHHLMLQNMYVALINHQYQHVQFLLEHTLRTAHEERSLPFYEVGMELHMGRLRTENEDCVLAMQGICQATREPFGLFVVCDGMGGHEHGQEAAHLAAQTVGDSLWPYLIYGVPAHHAHSFLTSAIEQANRQIYQRNQATKEEQSTTRAFMGTTITAVLLLGEHAYGANVGDSRTYHSTNGALKQISRDHSVVAHMVAEGLLSTEDRYRHPVRNRITRALGLSPSVLVDPFRVPFSGNETLLLCSDGLWEMMRDREIEQVLVSSEMSAAHMAEQLVNEANSNGGFDNIACVVVRSNRQLYKMSDSLVQSQVPLLALMR